MDRIQTFTVLGQVPAASLNTIQDTALGIAQVNGLWSSRPTLAYLSGSNLLIGAYGPLVLGSTVFPAGVASTLALGAVTSDTWYYVYASNASGNLVFSYQSGAPPNGELTLKNGDPAKAYVGCFRVTSAGAIAPFRLSNRRYTYAPTYYTTTGWTNSYTLVVNAGTNNVQPLDLSQSLPPHAAVARVYVDLLNTNASTSGVSIGFRTTGASGTLYQSVQVGGTFDAGTPYPILAWNGFDLVTDILQQAEYAVLSTDAPYACTLNVNGFQEGL